MSENDSSWADRPQHAMGSRSATRSFSIVRCVPSREKRKVNLKKSRKGFWSSKAGSHASLRTNAVSFSSVSSRSRHMPSFHSSLKIMDGFVVPTRQQKQSRRTSVSGLIPTASHNAHRPSRPMPSSSSAYRSNISIIFSGSIEGGSGGLFSLRLPLRSRRAAAARSCAAILSGLAIIKAAPARRREVVLDAARCC